jgi:hypothetical protein
MKSLSTVAAGASAFAGRSSGFPSIHEERIRDYINFKLDVSGQSLRKWRNLFLFLINRHRAQSHIQPGNAARHADEAWHDEDVTIVSWIITTLSDALLDIVFTPDMDAHAAWACLNTYFYDNMEARAMLLNKEFRSLKRNDLSIDTYCGKMKSIADALADVGAPITDRALTMQMLDGLGGKFALLSAVFQGGGGAFPTFAEALSRLRIAEIAMDTNAKEADAQVNVIQNNDRGRGDTNDRGRGDRGYNGNQGGYTGNQGGGFNGNQGGDRG